MSWLKSLAANPFHRFVNRSLLIVAVVGLWPLSRSLEMRSWGDLGLARPKGQWGRLAGGFGLGLGSLAVVVTLVLAAGARGFNWGHSLLAYASHGLNAGLAAVVVGLLEEVLFRGFLFGGLRRTFLWPAALVLSSVVFALAHFLQRPVSPEPHGWLAGLVVLGRMLRGFGQLEALVPGFFCLSLIGILLGWAYQRTGNLYFSIGLHAGWIFWLKTYGFLTKPVAGVNIWFWGSAKLIDGWLGLIVIALTGIVIWRWLRAPQPQALKR
jgi:membrane protease YdiL (CAAX protease family)